MKQALTIGCGGGNGSVVIDTLLEKGYNVTNLGNNEHPGATNVQIAWTELQIANLHKLLKFEVPLDFIFFNQNASSLDSAAFDFSNTDTLTVWKLIKNWQHSYWISCQMPFLLLHNLKHNLTPQTKIGWMLSSNMIWNRPDVQKHPDYSSQKYFNYLAMNCFSKHYQTFGIMPDFSIPNAKNEMTKIIATVCNQDVDNTIFKFISEKD
jgi:hypothetical protein